MNLIESILQSKNKVYFGITGGGTRAISMLLENGGASNVFLGATVPYCQEELLWEAGPHVKAVSPDIAIKLSQCVSRRSIPEKLTDTVCIGIGVTCSLQKATKERAGREHNVFIAVSSHTDKETKSIELISLQLKKERTRKEEEELIARLILSLSCIHMNLTKWHVETYKPVSDWVGITVEDKLEVKKL